MPRNKIRIKYTKNHKNCIISDLTDYHGIKLSSIVFPTKTEIIIQVVRLVGERIVAIEEQLLFGQMFDFAMNPFLKRHKETVLPCIEVLMTQWNGV